MIKLGKILRATLLAELLITELRKTRKGVLICFDFLMSHLSTSEKSSMIIPRFLLSNIVKHSQRRKKTLMNVFFLNFFDLFITFTCVINLFSTLIYGCCRVVSFLLLSFLVVYPTILHETIQIALN